MLGLQSILLNTFCMYRFFVIASTSISHTNTCSPEMYRTRNNEDFDTFVLGRLAIDSSQVIKSHPPNFKNNKKVVFDIICPKNKSYKSVMEYARYTAMPVKASQDIDLGLSSHGLETVLHEGPFVYGPTENLRGKPTLQWHVNFADPKLFGYYSSSLFAQDEWQVLEHPVLGSLRDYLEWNVKESQFSPWTIDHENGIATPCLIRNVERHGIIETNPDASKGRPYSLYGNQFHVTPADIIAKSAIPLNPATLSNIIAMAAPVTSNHGIYTRSEIMNILTTAYTAFAAARHETKRWAIDDKAGLNPLATSCNGNNIEVGVIIHTGNWGTGAFGGNKVIMSLLQLYAAELAGIDRLIFHSPGGGNHFNEAKLILDEMRYEQNNKHQGKMVTEDFVSQVEKKQFRWGIGDGN